MSEAELIEHYMDALRQDPDALPPAGLDAETALMVRALVVTHRPPLDVEARQERTWNRLLFAMHCAPDELAQMPTPPPVTQSSPLPRRRIKLHTPLVMVAAAMLFLAGLLVFQPHSDGIGLHSAAFSREEVRVDNAGYLVIEAGIVPDANLRPIVEVAQQLPELPIGGEAIPLSE